MRWTSLAGAAVLAAALTLGLQPEARSADTSAAADAGSWQTQVVVADGEATGISVEDPLQVLRAELRPGDPVAVLMAMNFTLNEVEDGSTYLWRRKEGPLRGAIRPTASFRDPDGSICRRLSVTLTVGPVSRWTDAVACRQPSGQWIIGG